MDKPVRKPTDEEIADTAKLVDAPSYTEDAKAAVVQASEAMAVEIAAWKEFWDVWAPGGLKKRKRYRTQGHGGRKLARRKKNKIARVARRADRRAKKRRR